MAGWEAAPERADPSTVDRLLSIDRYNEPAMRVRMILLARDGRRTAAIEAAEGFANLLSTELGIAPTDRLAEVADGVRAGVFESGDVRGGELSTARHGRYTLTGAAAVLVMALALNWFGLARDSGPPPDIATLLVRPFEAEAGVSPELATGFSDDLATELVRRAGVQVLSRESGRLIPGADDAASGASHVLRGRMRAEDGDWILNVWITETASGREVWADRFRGRVDAPRTVRDDILARISDGIGVTVAELPEPAPVALPSDAVPDYLRALSFLHSGTASGNAEALDRLRVLADAYPDSVEPVAALVLGYERVAFGADDFARAAGLHWLQGYLMLKRQLAVTEAETPGLLAARARLALRRLDHEAAQALARRALGADDSNVAALEVFAQSLALSGETAAARQYASRAITLSPAAPEEGYTALALAAFAEGDLGAAGEAVETALDTGRAPPLQLMALRAAIPGLLEESAAAYAAFSDLASAVESRPFGAWRMGDVTYANPRAATWRRPVAAEAASLIRFSDEALQSRLLQGLNNASGEADSGKTPQVSEPLSGPEIEDLLFDRRILGQRTWLVLEPWTQTRTSHGTLFQEGTFGPLPRAQEGLSTVTGARLCDRWSWQDAELENCQIVLRGRTPGTFALFGETGRFPFSVSSAHLSPDR